MDHFSSLGKDAELLMQERMPRKQHYSIILDCYNYTFSRQIVIDLSSRGERTNRESSASPVGRCLQNLVKMESKLGQNLTSIVSTTLKAKRGKMKQSKVIMNLRFRSMIHA